MSRKTELEKIAYKKIKVNEQYRFFNSNYTFNDNVIPFFKHEKIIKNLKNRICFSNGAAFLITGLRGVGKSTLVKRALNELRKEKKSCLPVYINLSRNIEYKELLFEIVRRLYETIIDYKVFDLLDTQIAKQIVIAYSRTSMAISNRNTTSNTTEIQMNNNYLLGNILSNNQITIQSAEEATFLAYSVNDVEHDLLRIVELLNSDKELKIVIVFDELDKLVIDDSGMKYFEDILGKLKNILCSMDAISIFIGGLELYQKWNDDVAKINSIYESIFSWHQYVPCIWDSTETLFELIMEKQYVYEKLSDEFQFICKEKYTNLLKKPFEFFLAYINFKCKGIPRRVYSEFNKFIVWNNGKPYFQITEIDIKEILAYSEIWKKISPIFEDKLYGTIIEMDLTYVTCFNIIEFFFLHAEDEFTLEQVQKTLLYDKMLTPVSIEQIITNLMERFVERHMIQCVQGDKFIVTDRTIKQKSDMAIKDRTLLHNKFEQEDDDINKNGINNNPSFKRRIKRYKSNIIEEFWISYKAEELFVNQANMSIFYVTNIQTNKKYNAILYTDIHNEKMKGKICLYNNQNYAFSSKYLTNTEDIIIDSCIKTSLREIYEGYLLSDLIKAGIKKKYVLLIIEQILEFLIEINKGGYFNANIKASNIVINKFLNVKILDIKSLIKINSSGMQIVTRGYAAPEMYTDSYDMRSDIYSVGVLLWEMLTKQCLREMQFERHIDFEFLNKPMQCSKKLWKIIKKATEYDPELRYQNPQDFLSDIHNCWEYKYGRCKVRKVAVSGTVKGINYIRMEQSVFNEAAYVKGEDSEIIVNTTSDSCSYNTQLLLEDGIGTVILQNRKTDNVVAYLIRKQTNEIFKIIGRECIIGKDESSVDICISDNNSISKIQAKIKKENDNYYISDCNSANHTYLNEMRLESEKYSIVKDGDIIRFGNEEFVFKCEQVNN